ncbi:hypothetical protein TNCV_3536551 [Trichonephila clavipes]|uniref:Uncharacterized protein n=1 Tax=Trichonephila clavipes TaxID=2585209 RepID=A0A8X6VWV9_TRICX|nr:hypothetical protein TNCV_3536551 [Trichonephila clavipes]
MICPLPPEVLLSIASAKTGFFPLPERIFNDPVSSNLVTINRRFLAVNGPFRNPFSVRNFRRATIADYRFDRITLLTTLDLRSYCIRIRTATAGSDVVQSGRPIFDDFFQHLWPYIGNNMVSVVFQMVKRLWLIRIDQ